MLSEQTLTYLLSFMLRQPPHASWIGYTADSSRFANYRIVIVPSMFFTPGCFGRAISRPTLPLQELEGVPILFGKPVIEQQENTIILYADLVASAFFLLSRYEETICPQRDRHGRFPGKDSILYLHGCLDRPIVDEYGRLLRRLLRETGVGIAEPASGFSHIYLTHDADKIEQYRNIRGFCGGVMRALHPLRRNSLESLAQVFRSALLNINNDPLYTFPWLFEQNRKLPAATGIVFVKAGKSDIPEDQPCYDLRSNDVQMLIRLCRENGVQIGLHTSYLAGEHPEFIATEKQRLATAIQTDVTANRHHFLRSCEPGCMRALPDAGITDDFTMGYADVAGFRLGTCHAVRWIDPKTKELTALTLHPMTVMDGTLNGKQYMNLDYEQALDYCQKLIAEVKKHGGEIVLLWHNSSIGGLEKNYHKQLYLELIQELHNETSAADN